MPSSQWIGNALRRYALAFAILPVLASVAPHAQGQTFSALYSFQGSKDGWNLIAGVVRDSAGNLYGATQNGGYLGCALGCGTVFKLDATGKEVVLYAFGGGVDGRFPAAAVIRDAAGNLFSTTLSGGAFGGGTAFKVDSAGNQTVLHSFGSGTDGGGLFAGLTPVGATFYGTTVGGGAHGFGTVFELDKSGQETVVYSFKGGADGDGPFAGVISDRAGNFYGTTDSGGTTSYGTVFKLDSSGNETVLHTFTGVADGAYPYGGVIRDSAGNLYGTTYGAEPHHGFGNVFKIAP